MNLHYVVMCVKNFMNVLFYCTHHLMKLQCANDKNSVATISSSSPTHNQQYKLRQMVWDIFESGRVRNAFSIGCGPGNDAFGLLALFQIINDRRKKKWDEASNSNHNYSNDMRHSFSDDNPGIIPLKRLILMDWAIEEWNTVLEPFQSLLNEKKLVLSIETCFCDVTIPCFHQNNTKARQLISSSLNSIDDATIEYDIYLISYLISETRNKWEAFFTDLIN